MGLPRPARPTGTRVATSEILGPRFHRQGRALAAAADRDLLVRRRLRRGGNGSLHGRPGARLWSGWRLGGNTLGVARLQRVRCWSRSGPGRTALVEPIASGRVRSPRPMEGPTNGARRPRGAEARLGTSVSRVCDHVRRAVSVGREQQLGRVTADEPEPVLGRPAPGARWSDHAPKRRPQPAKRPEEIRVNGRSRCQAHSRSSDS